MPAEFISGPHAAVEIGGGVHGKVLRIQADDESCRWNGFPIYMWACASTPTVGGDEPTSRLVTDPLTLTAFGTGHDTSTPAEWPPVYIADALQSIISGYSIQVRLTGTFISPGIFGNALATNPFTGTCVTWNQGADGNPVDTGWVDCTPSCVAMGAESTLKIQPTLSNGSAVGWTFSDFLMETRWVSGGAVAPYCPNQEFAVGWYPSCPLSGGTVGLFIALETDSCGQLTLEYDDVLNYVNGLNLGLTLSALGGHGHDIATPDPFCVTDQFTVGCCGGPTFIFSCEMSGATCSGAVDTDEGN